jgi:hypothetical protein
LSSRSKRYLAKLKVKYGRALTHSYTIEVHYYIGHRMMRM